jgi:hypothetical protein
MSGVRPEEVGPEGGDTVDEILANHGSAGLNSPALELYDDQDVDNAGSELAD